MTGWLIDTWHFNAIFYMPYLQCATLQCSEILSVHTNATRRVVLPAQLELLSVLYLLKLFYRWILFVNSTLKYEWAWRWAVKLSIKQQTLIASIMKPKPATSNLTSWVTDNIITRPESSSNRSVHTAAAFPCNLRKWRLCVEKSLVWTGINH